VSEVTAGEVAAAMKTNAAQAETKVGTLILRHGFETERMTKANASGRPGPNPGLTGDFRRGWTTTTMPTRQHVVGVIIGNRVPYAMRLEFGFTGTDSANRAYKQDPYPSVGPAIAVTAPLLAKDLGELGLFTNTKAGLF